MHKYRNEVTFWNQDTTELQQQATMLVSVGLTQDWTTLQERQKTSGLVIAGEATNNIKTDCLTKMIQCVTMYNTRDVKFRLKWIKFGH